VVKAIRFDQAQNLMDELQKGWRGATVVRRSDAAKRAPKRSPRCKKPFKKRAACSGGPFGLA